MTQKDVDRLIERQVRPSLEENIGEFLELKFPEKALHVPEPVTFPIDFRRAANKKKQLEGTPDFPETTWEDNTPRKGLSSDGYGLVAYVPRVLGLQGTVSIYQC